MEVRVAGRLKITFFPRLVVTLADVRVRNRAAEVASAKEATISIDLVSVLA